MTSSPLGESVATTTSKSPGVSGLALRALVETAYRFLQPVFSHGKTILPPELHSSWRSDSNRENTLPMPSSAIHIRFAVPSAALATQMDHGLADNRGANRYG